MSLAPLVAPISTALGGLAVAFAADCIGPPARQVAEALPESGVALFENLRFHEGEEANDPAFAKELAALGSCYVNDAFSAAHRAHASVGAITRFLPSAAGLLMQAELDHLEAALETPKRPLVAVVGGAKVSTKLELLGNLVKRVDSLIIGGGMANTFLAAQGLQVGRSLCEHEMAQTARDILQAADAAGCRVLLPEDVVIAKALQAGVDTQVVAADAVPEDALILDCGPATAAFLAASLADAATLVWNGPLGCFETPPFDAATNRLAQAAARLTAKGRLLSVAGGGDTVAALAHAGVLEDFSYVSTAGGAFLQWLEGKTLPGIEALEAAA
jgi:phosphoglycerate kinase